MPNVYPGNHGAGCANDFIYRHMTHLFINRKPGEIVSDPQSSIARNAGWLIGALRELEIEDQRIATVTAIAHIDLLKQATEPSNIVPEGFNEQV